VAVEIYRVALPATAKGTADSRAAGPTVETRASWFAAGVVLFIFTFSYGAPLIAPVALKAIAADLGSSRSVPALANALAWLGSGAGALAFGWVAERFGIRRTAFFGAVMIGAGLAIASQGGTWELLIGHGVLIGLLGGGATNVPLIIYISRWFDRRRGSAVALISCGQYIAGILWPPLIALGIEHLGWRPTMLAFGVASGVCMVLSVLIFLRPIPESVRTSDEGDAHRALALRMSHRMVFVLLCIAGFLCCTPMAMPPAHLVALCSDLGIAPAQGAMMLSVLLGSALVSRLFWGWLSDHVGGLYTILAASVCQAAALAAFIVTQDEAGLFAVSAAFGAGFSGIIPAYVVVLRQIFPAVEASWRVPIWFFANICGMALGGWFAGAMYDQLGSYAPAFAAGVAFNVANIALIGWLAMRLR
jgi:MFS family permease